MVGRAEWPVAADLPIHERARDAGDHRGFERLGRSERGQDAGQATCQQAFARARRPDHQQVVAPGGGDFERALCRLLPFDHGEVVASPRRLGLTRLRRGQALGAFEVVQQRDQIGRGNHLDPARPARLAALSRRANKPFLDTARMKRGEQHAGRGDHPAIERQFADRDVIADLLKIDHAHRREQRQRDRQVVVAALLGQVGGRQVDRDPLGRQRQPQCRERGANPLAAFADRLVGQPDEEEAGDAGADLALHLDRARL